VSRSKNYPKIQLTPSQRSRSDALQKAGRYLVEIAAEHGRPFRNVGYYACKPHLVELVEEELLLVVGSGVAALKAAKRFAERWPLL